jgi:hypothetical protein
MQWLRPTALSAAMLFAVVFVAAALHCREGANGAGLRTDRRRTDRRGTDHQPAERRLAFLLPDPERRRITAKAAEQKRFISAQGFDIHICFLVDMQVHSGRARFFVYDLDGDSILMAGLVAHGCGDQRFSEEPVFSNRDGSHCSSLGRYRVGKPYKGAFGRSYILYGMDPTNDKAYTRHVVLHGYAGVPEEETEPQPICNSLGCPMVAPGFLQKISPLIDHSKKPVLLWVFD